MPVVYADNLLDDSESQTDTILSGSEEWLKDMLPVLIWNARAVIPHLDRHMGIVHMGPEDDLASGVDGLEGVNHQVQKHLYHLLFVAQDCCRALLKFCHKADVLACRLWGQHRGRLLQDRMYVLQNKCRGLRSGETEQGGTS